MFVLYCTVYSMFYDFIILYTFITPAFCSEGNPPLSTHYFILSLITDGVCGLMIINQGRQRHHFINITITALYYDLFST